MFITAKRRGYTRNGQQVASGLFLILMQPKESEKYPSMTKVCSDCGRDSLAHEESRLVPIPVCEVHGVMARIKRRIASGQEVLDSEFEESPAIGCFTCKARKSQIALAGCTYFRPNGITYPMRALVRFVSMQQCGHFMMGNARVRGHKLTLSGSYGSDGLPDTVPDTVYEQGIFLPQELYEAWKNGGGWNSAGSEAFKMQEWALVNLKQLRA